MIHRSHLTVNNWPMQWQLCTWHTPTKNRRCSMSHSKSVIYPTGNEEMRILMSAWLRKGELYLFDIFFIYKSKENADAWGIYTLNDKYKSMFYIINRTTQQAHDIVMTSYWRWWHRRQNNVIPRSCACLENAKLAGYESNGQRLANQQVKLGVHGENVAWHLKTYVSWHKSLSCIMSNRLSN